MKAKNSPFPAGLLIYDVSRLLRSEFDRQARTLGFNTGQWRALWRLGQNPGVGQAALSEMLEMQPISVTRVIDRLEECGLVERRPHPTDRRAVKLYLQPKAEPLLESLWEIGAKTRETAMTGLSAREQSQLLTLLERLKSNLSAAKDETGTSDDERGENNDERTLTAKSNRHER